ncbi:hypothetical protein AAG570_000316 [Ranatra chinensis]|uniref:Uncharacterized protein n=1 Tax=Ranatra chinensis TaxID=642074 RepID=A0ABD0ZK06_9HEMI
MASKRRNMFQENKTQETTENGHAIEEIGVQNHGECWVEVLYQRRDHFTALRIPGSLEPIRGGSRGESIKTAGAELAAGTGRPASGEMNYLALAVFLTGAVLGAAGAAKVEETDALGVMGLVPCLEAARPGSCLKARTTRLVENWLIAQDEKEELTGGTREGRSEGQDDTLPEGLPPFVQRLVDSLVNRLSRLFTGGKDDEEEDSEEPTAPKPGPEKEGQRNQVEGQSIQSS